MAKKWRKLASFGRKRELSATPTLIANRGHVFVYAIDGKRFMVPLTYLSNCIFRELFRMSEDEFGLPSDGPILLPCDATDLEYILSLLSRRMSLEIEEALLISISFGRCIAHSLTPDRSQHHLVV